MLFRNALLLLALAPTAASASSAKSQLLSKARRLENQERDISWLPNYSIKFQKCHSLIQVSGEEGNGGGDGEGSLLYTQNLVEFSVCPSSSCATGSGCSNGGKYIVNMREFVELYSQMKEEEREQACEAVRENCNNDDENYCYAQQGMDYCIEDEDGGEEEDMERYMECEALENDGGNNNNNYNYNNGNGYYKEYFVGPYCSESGDSIHLGTFLDEGCSIKAEDGAYEAMNYGKSLPYSTTSIIEKDCISCLQVDENDNNNNNNNNNNNGNDDGQEVEIIELCEEMYEQAGRCEKNLQGVQYTDTSACEFIESILPRLEGASRSIYRRNGGNNSTAVGFAWAFGIIALVLGIYSFLLYRRLRRSKVALNPNASGNGAMA